LADHHSQGNLGISTCGDLTRIAVTRAGILTSVRSSVGYPFAFIAEQNALLPRRIPKNTASAVSVPYLSPDHLRRRVSGSVSCYAIFKGWLLLSQPPDCHRNSTSLQCTEYGFWDLNWRSGLFPFRPMELSPHSLTAILLTSGIRSLIGLTRFLPVQTFQCSTPKGNI
jgi:hypothetical protein